MAVVPTPPGNVVSLRPRLFERACDEANAQRMVDELRELGSWHANCPPRLRLVPPDELEPEWDSEDPPHLPLRRDSRQST